jgi:hypothetical protein
MIMRMFEIVDKAKPNVEGIRSLNLAKVSIGPFK